MDLGGRSPPLLEKKRLGHYTMRQDSTLDLLSLLSEDFRMARFLVRNLQIRIYGA